MEKASGEVGKKEKERPMWWNQIPLKVLSKMQVKNQFLLFYCLISPVYQETHISMINPGSK